VQGLDALDASSGSLLDDRQQSRRRSLQNPRFLTDLLFRRKLFLFLFELELEETPHLYSDKTNAQGDEECG